MLRRGTFRHENTRDSGIRDGQSKPRIFGNDDGRCRATSGGKIGARVAALLPAVYGNAAPAAWVRYLKYSSPRSHNATLTNRGSRSHNRPVDKGDGRLTRIRSIAEMVAQTCHDMLRNALNRRRKAPQMLYRALTKATALTRWPPESHSGGLCRGLVFG